MAINDFTDRQNNPPVIPDIFQLANTPTPPIAQAGGLPGGGLQQFSSDGLIIPAPPQDTPAAVPLAGGVTIPRAPGTGTVAIPTEAFKARQQKEARTLRSEAEMQQRIRQSGSISATQKIARSLRDQGVSEDEIRSALETPTVDGRTIRGEDTPERKLARLSQLQKKATFQRSGKGISSRTRDRIVQSARFDEGGNPKNAAGRAQQFTDFIDDLGPDPQSDKTNFDSMTPSEKREFSRGLESMSRGTQTGEQQRRLANIQKRVEKRRGRDFSKKEADRVQSASDLKTQNTKSLIKSREQKEEFKREVKDQERLKEAYKAAVKDFGADSEQAVRALSEWEGFKFSVTDETDLAVTDDQIRSQIPDVTDVELGSIRRALDSGVSFETILERANQ